MKNIKKTAKKIGRIISNIIMLGLVIIAGLFIYQQVQGPKVIEKEVQVVVEKNIGVSLENKVEELKQNLMDDLREKEVGSLGPDDLIIVFDPTRKNLSSCQKVGGVKLYCYSFGPYNFKITTMQHYYKKFYGEDLTQHQALEYALDEELSREVAYKVIFEEVGGIWNWENSANKINAKARIEIIRELEN